MVERTVAIIEDANAVPKLRVFLKETISSGLAKETSGTGLLLDLGANRELADKRNKPFEGRPA